MSREKAEELRQQIRHYSECIIECQDSINEQQRLIKRYKHKRNESHVRLLICLNRNQNEPRERM